MQGLVRINTDGLYSILKHDKYCLHKSHRQTFKDRNTSIRYSKRHGGRHNWV